MEDKLREALAKLIAAIEDSDAGWNGIDAFPEDYQSLIGE